MSKLKKAILVTERKPHPLCERCYNKQPPKGHSRSLDSNKYDFEWVETDLVPRKKKQKDKPIQIRKIIIKKDRKGKRYPHPFQALVPSCTGLDIKILEKNNYPYIDRPPCFVDKDRVKNARHG